MKLFVTLCTMGLIGLSSCQKEDWGPSSHQDDSSQTPAVVEAPPVDTRIDLVKLNFIWVEMAPSLANNIAARLEIRDENDSLIMSGLDMITGQDSMFQWYPSEVLLPTTYHFVLKSPTGQTLETADWDFMHAYGNDEYVVNCGGCQLFMQMTWFKGEPELITETN